MNIILYFSPRRKIIEITNLFIWFIILLTTHTRSLVTERLFFPCNKLVTTNSDTAMLQTRNETEKKHIKCMHDFFFRILLFCFALWFVSVDLRYSNDQVTSTLRFDSRLSTEKLARLCQRHCRMEWCEYLSVNLDGRFVVNDPKLL